MKKIILAAAALLVGASAFAETYSHILRVNLKDGDKIDFLFSNTPVATFEGSDMTITTNHGNDKVICPVSDVANMVIAEVDTDIKNIEAGTRPSFAVNSSVVDGAGLIAGSRVDIYDMSGRKAASGIADSDGRVSISVESLPDGVYAVNASGIKFKFIK